MDYEYTILQKPAGVCVFKLPNLTSSKGYYLDDWKEMIWEGGLKATSKDNTIFVHLVNKDKSVFGTAPIPIKTEEAVHRTVDSSRGYALRLQAANGKFAWIGMCFRDRNDAFDFTVCLQDFREKLDNEKNPSKLAKEFETNVDFSLKPGEKLNLNFGASNTSKNNENSNQGFNAFKIDGPEENKAGNQNDVMKFGTFGNSLKSAGSFGDFNFNDWGNSNNQGQIGEKKTSISIPPASNNDLSGKQKAPVNLLDIF